MIMQANRTYILEKLDALNEAIENINKQEMENPFAGSMRTVLVGRLEKERDRLSGLLPIMKSLA